jgi:hypothetical protein
MKLVQKLAIAGIAVASLFTAYAQNQVMRVSVPFAFHAGDRTLPAGAYDIRSDYGHNRIAIVAADGKTGCYLQVRNAVVPTKIRRGSLVFHAYGSAYFLNRVDNPGLSNGYEMYPGRAEKEMAKVETPYDMEVATEGTR